MNQPQDRSARDDVLVPLFIAQVPQKTLARKGLSVADWELGVAQIANIRLQEASVLDTFISLEQYRQLVLLGKKLFGEGELIRWWSTDLQPIHSGPIGQAATAARTIKESINVLAQYVPVAYPPIQLDVTDKKRNCVLNIKLMHAMPEVEDIVIELVALSLTRTFLYLGVPPSDIQVRFSHSRKIEHEHYMECFGISPSFSQTSTTVGISRSWLDKINDDASPLVYQQATRDCIALKTKLEGLSTLSKRAYQILLEGARLGTLFSMEELADKLAMSHRSVSRKLKEEGTTFRALQADARLDLAKEQLSCSDRPIKIICVETGYQNLSAFSRAFREKTGISPTEYREKHRPSK